MDLKIAKISAVSFLIISFVLIWQIFNIYPEVDVMSEKIKEKEAVVKDSENTLRRAKEFIDFASKNQETIDKFNIILPGSEDKANLLSTLENIASINGLNTLKIIFEDDSNIANGAVAAGSEAQKKYDVESKKIRIFLRGTYPSFKSFLVMVGNNLRIMDVVSVDFSAVSGGKEGEEIKKEYLFEVKIKAYLYSIPREGKIAGILSSLKFKNFTVNDLGFVKEKMFSDLVLSPRYNIDIGESEIGNPDVF